MDKFDISKKTTLWHLTKEGNARPTKTAETKSEIISIMKEYMSNKNASVRIHKEDGKIQEVRTYKK